MCGDGAGGRSLAVAADAVMVAVEAVAVVMVVMSDFDNNLGTGRWDQRGEEQEGEQGEHVSLHTLF